MNALEGEKKKQEGLVKKYGENLKENEEILKDVRQKLYLTEKDLRDTKKQNA